MNATVAEFIYRDCRARMLSGDTILWSTDFVPWRPVSIVCPIIRACSKADVNHASTVINLNAIGVDRIMIAEAKRGGIQLHSLTERLRKHHGEAYWLPLKQEYNFRRPGIRAWALEHIDVGYDYSDLFKQALVRVRPDVKRLFCSEFDYLAKKLGGRIEFPVEVKYAPRPGDMEALGIYEARIRIK